MKHRAAEILYETIQVPESLGAADELYFPQIGEKAILSRVMARKADPGQGFYTAVSRSAGGPRRGIRSSSERPDWRSGKDPEGDKASTAGRCAARGR